MTRLTNASLLVRVVDSVEEHIKDKKYIYNFPFSQLMLCTGGNGFFISGGGREIPVSVGDIIVVEPAVICGLRVDGEELVIKKIACDTSGAPNLIAYFSGEQILYLKNAPDKIRNEFIKIFDECNHTSVSEKQETSLQMYALLIQIGKHYVKANDNMENICEKMTAPFVEYMLGKFNASDEIQAPPQVDELFRMAYGMSAGEYNIYIRLVLSKADIVFAPSYEDVARYWGFESVDDFKSRFMEMNKISVEKFRSLY
ncbi:MAG: hypothetical protein ACI4SS_05480, partial [Clostridia bacterium]